MLQIKPAIFDAEDKELLGMLSKYKNNKKSNCILSGMGKRDTSQ